MSLAACLHIKSCDKCGVVVIGDETESCTCERFHKHTHFIDQPYFLTYSSFCLAVCSA